MRFSLIFLPLLFLGRPASAETPLAFSLEPLQAEFVLPADSQTFTLRNLTNIPRKLRVDVLDRRQVGEREINRKTSELRVLENQIHLPPEGVKTFAVEYRGPRALKIERAYRLVVTDETPNLGNMTALKLSYRASMFAREKAHVPEVVVQSWKPKGGVKFEVVLKNRGKVRQYLSGMGFKGLDLSKDSIRTLETGVLLAGDESKLNLEAADELQLEKLKSVSGLVVLLPETN